MTGTRPEDIPTYLFNSAPVSLLHDGTKDSAGRIRTALQGTTGLTLINITDPARHPQALVRIAYHQHNDSGARRRPRFISPGDSVIIQDAQAWVRRDRESDDLAHAEELITRTLQRASTYPPDQIPEDMALAVQLADVLDQLLRG